MAPSILDGLPAAVRHLAGTLARTEPASEPRADCTHCPMVGVDPHQPARWQFRGDVRCCGFHPPLANFLVGAALAGGGRGEQLVRQRIAARDGVTRWGIYPGADTQGRYAATARTQFGGDRSQRCPYAADGPHLCSIWPARPAVCRTWFCKHDGGQDGALGWSRIEAMMWAIENRLAFRLMELGTSERIPVISEDQWSDDDFDGWYRWCAERGDRLTPHDVAGMDSPALDHVRDAMTSPAIPSRPAMPDILVPAVSQMVERDERVMIAGYSHYDAIAAPRTVFALLARLDGDTTWREAIAAATTPAEMDRAEALVRELYRVGALRPAPTSAAATPH